MGTVVLVAPGPLFSCALSSRDLCAPVCPGVSDTRGSEVCFGEACGGDGAAMHLGALGCVPASERGPWSAAGAAGSDPSESGTSSCFEASERLSFVGCTCARLPLGESPAPAFPSSLATPVPVGVRVGPTSINGTGEGEGGPGVFRSPVAPQGDPGPGGGGGGVSSVGRGSEDEAGPSGLAFIGSDSTEGAARARRPRLGLALGNCLLLAPVALGGTTSASFASGSGSIPLAGTSMEGWDGAGSVRGSLPLASSGPDSNVLLAEASS